MSKSKKQVVNGKVVVIDRKNVLIDNLSEVAEKIKDKKVQGEIVKKAMKATTKELTGLIGEAKKELKKQK